MLHNGENTIPYDLPNTKTQSYIKTQTTPQYTDTEGYNEIHFEDANSNEQFNMRAQKDYSLLVLHDATEHIQHDRSETVDNNEDVTIHGYRQERVNKSKTETIDIAKALTIGAGYQVSVGASKNETVGISRTEQVGVMKSTIVGKEYTITVGNSTIHMSSEGTIEITASNIQVSASEYVEIKGKKVCVNGGCEGEKKAKASSVKEEVYNQQFRLIDHGTGEILPYTKYKLTASTGETLEGISDESGLTERLHTKADSEVTIEIFT
jgi:type VI secretion system secreted protein VgrG